MSEPRGNAVNYVKSANGAVCAVCECCGKRSRPGKPNNSGEPDLWNMGRGWSEAPFPSDFVHRDGSIGSTYTCPACNKKLRAGAELQLRAYLRREVRA